MITIISLRGDTRSDSLFLWPWTSVCVDVTPVTFMVSLCLLRGLTREGGWQSQRREEPQSSMKTPSHWVTNPGVHSTSALLVLWYDKVTVFFQSAPHFTGSQRHNLTSAATARCMSWSSLACATSKSHSCPGCTSRDAGYLRAAPDISSLPTCYDSPGLWPCLNYDVMVSWKTEVSKVSLNSESTLDIHRGHALRSLSSLQILW